MAETTTEPEIPGIMGETDETDPSQSETVDPEPETTEADAEPTEEPVDDGAAEPDVAEADLSSDDMGGGGDLFAGIEDASDDGEDSDDAIDDPLDALDDRGGAMEDAINDGAARLAVVGVDDEDDPDALEDEMRDVFEAFRLGYFGAEFFEEYILIDDEDSIDPAWGFAGAAVCCLAICLFMRPDGDEKMVELKDAVANIAGGSL